MPHVGKKTINTTEAKTKVQKRKWLYFLLLLLLAGCAALCLGACAKGGRDLSGKIKVTYELEGGVYQNCDRAVVQYYEKTDAAQTATDPTTFSGKEVTRAGYTLEGWYREKSEADGKTTYSSKWDFSSDKIPEDGLTLYARWVKNIRYTYEVCYLDDAGTTVVLGSYEAEKGEAFNSYYATRYGKLRTGYTALDGIYDREGNAWDASFTHPGGEVDTAVQVYLHFIRGSFQLIHNASELVRYKTSNLYLVSDIDFGGEKFGGFGSYKGTIEGNGHTIRNFTLSYDNTKDGLVSDADLSDEGGLLRIGLFTELSGAALRNVTFADFTIELNVGYQATKKIIVSPLAVKAKNATLEKVTVSGACVISRLPGGFDRENLQIGTDAVVWRPEGDTTDLSGASVTFPVTDNTGTDTDA